jgi:hypothetical protein
MIDDWQDISAAPKNEAVLVCLTDCRIVVAIQELLETTPRAKEWTWINFHVRYSNGNYTIVHKPLMWRPIPLPPKHLYERKLVADLLEKQVKELRGE